jgi:ribosomal protein S27AE
MASRRCAGSPSRGARRSGDIPAHWPSPLSIDREPKIERMPMVSPPCPQCGATDWQPPRAEERQIVFSAWQVVCGKCGYETLHTLGSLVEADEPDGDEP